MSRAITEIAGALNHPVLQKEPFPEAVTARSESFAARVAEWAETARRTILRDAERLRSKPDGEEP